MKTQLKTRKQATTTWHSHKQTKIIHILPLSLAFVVPIIESMRKKKMGDIPLKYFSISIDCWWEWKLFREIKQIKEEKKLLEILKITLFTLSKKPKTKNRKKKILYEIIHILSALKTGPLKYAIKLHFSPAILSRVHLLFFLLSHFYKRISVYPERDKEWSGFLRSL